MLDFKVVNPLQATISSENECRVSTVVANPSTLRAYHKFQKMSMEISLAQVLVKI